MPERSRRGSSPAGSRCVSRALQAAKLWRQMKSLSKSACSARRPRARCDPSRRGHRFRFRSPTRHRRCKGARRTEELVRAALRHEVERDPGRSQRRIGSSGRNLDAAERVEVVVERRHAPLADRDAVQVVAVLSWRRALPDEGRLPRAPAPSDVHVGNQNSGNLPQDGPGVPCRRNAFELLLTKGRARLNRPTVQRRVAGNRDRFRHPRNGHDGREHRVAERHGDVPSHRSESRPLEPHGVGPRRKVQKVKIPPGVGVRCLCGPWPGEGHGHARDRGSLTVQHRAVKVPRRRRALGPGIGRQKRCRQHKRREGPREFHLALES